LEWIQNRTGTWNDPHIIENVTINGGKYGIGILIENSDDYFIIRNCSIYNSSAGQFDKAGILLKNTNNGTLINNNLSYNNGSGLILENSINNTISSNNITYNKEYGISLIGQSQNNTITGNNIDNNTIYGILFNYTTRWNTIYNNNFTKNEINAWDNGTDNRWYVGTTGNYWDDYQGCDSNGDNRGEIPYMIPGSAVAQDLYPISYKKCPSSPREAKSAVEEDEGLKEAYSAANKIFENIVDNIGFIALGLILVEIAVGLLIFVNKNRKYRLNDKF
jgi:parallel beta-helix repeat protein